MGKKMSTFPIKNLHIQEINFCSCDFFRMKNNVWMKNIQNIFPFIDFNCISFTGICILIKNLSNVLHKSIYLVTDYKNISYCNIKYNIICKSSMSLICKVIFEKRNSLIPTAGTHLNVVNGCTCSLC